jgi:hypothetical protein
LFGLGDIPAGVTRHFNLLNLLIEAGRRRRWPKKSLTLGAAGRFMDSQRLNKKYYLSLIVYHDGAVL